jgi:hypothetical protein
LFHPQVKNKTFKNMSTCYNASCTDCNKVVVREADSTQNGDPAQVDAIDLSSNR